MVYNLTYTKEPSPESDAAWDSMFPSKPWTLSHAASHSYFKAEGVGFVKHPELSPNLSGLAIFHELHCVVSNPKAAYFQRYKPHPPDLQL